MKKRNKRRDTDLMKLMMSNHQVEVGDNMSDFYVCLKGPKTSYYEGGIWKIHVTLPDEYPYKSPSIGFCNKIFHPNVDEASGSVCLDVINQTWSPMFDLVNIFEVFIPQLLLYPNPSDPLNGDAASLMLKNKKEYASKIARYVKEFASNDFSMDQDESDDDTSMCSSSSEIQEEKKDGMDDTDDDDSDFEDNNDMDEESDGDNSDVNDEELSDMDDDSEMNDELSDMDEEGELLSD